MLQPSTLTFLKNLKKNNSRDWFEKHRGNFEAAKEDFTELVGHLIKGFGKKDKDIASQEAKDCVFRIYRDVRFSKNKTPYKSHLSASLDRDGKKSIFGGYYFHCEPGGKSFIGSGVWMREADAVKKLRQEIDYNHEEFLRIIKNKKFVAAFGELEREDALSREPKGYEKDNPVIEYLRLKSWVVTAPISDAELTEKGLEKKIIALFELSMPLVKFLNRALEG